MTTGSPSRDSACSCPLVPLSRRDGDPGPHAEGASADSVSERAREWRASWSSCRCKENALPRTSASESASSDALLSRAPAASEAARVEPAGARAANICIATCLFAGGMRSISSRFAWGSGAWLMGATCRVCKMQILLLRACGSPSASSIATNASVGGCGCGCGL